MSLFCHALVLLLQEPAADVVVVGRRVPDLADAPVAGVSLGSDGLEQRLISTLQDLGRSVPGFSVADTGPRPFGDVFSVRGLANTPFFSNPSLAFYVDDIPFGDSSTYVHTLELAERVDFLRGPQHTLFGRSAYGGAVNVVSRRPGKRPWTALVFDAGNHDSYSANAAFAAPLVEKALAVRLGAGWAQNDGYLKNGFLGGPADEQERYGGHLAAFWTPDARWDVSVTLAGDRYDDGAPRLNSLSAPDPYVVNSDVPGRLGLETDMQALRVAYRAEGVDFLAVTARRRWDADPYEFDLDFSPLPGNRVNFAQEQVIVSQELRATSRDPASAWSWVGGLYAHLKETDHDGTRDLLFPNPVPPPPFFAESQRTQFSAAETAFAAYGEAALKIDDAWRARLGARYDLVRESMERSKTSVLSPSPAPWDRAETYGRLTGRAGADLRLAEPVLLFFNAAVAFRPGGYSGFIDDPVTAEYDPETARTLEVGAKADLADGALRVDGALYHYWIDDYQYERSLPASTDYAVFNAEKAVSYGGELEVSGRPHGGVLLFGALGATRAVFTDHRDPFTAADYSGNRVPFVPNFSARVGTEFGMPLGPYARVEYVAKGDVYFDDANGAALREDSYGTWSAAVGWRGAGVQFTLYGHNLTDEFYWTSKIGTLQAGSPGPDRTIGVRLRLDF
jgi:iron complex outermembrane receptor protein